MTYLDNKNGPPHCSGSPIDQLQYCSLRPVYQNLWDNPNTSINKLVVYQGDCDNNSDWFQNLAYFQQNNGESGPPGCGGIPFKNYDY